MTVLRFYDLRLAAEVAAPLKPQGRKTTVKKTQDGKKIIKLIKKFGGRISGSYGRSREHPGSDFDFYMPKNKWQGFFDVCPKGFNSCGGEHVVWKNTNEGKIEVSPIFYKQECLKKTRAICGITFRTW